MRIFYVIFVRDEILDSYLNAIRYLSNPNEKYDVHITVRGPYDKSINIEKYNSIIKGETIKIVDVGCFFEENQNTVFLKCESNKLKEIWSKSDYGYNPHITLYDGKSRNFAKKLVKILRSHLINFTFKVRELSELHSIKGQVDYRLRLNANLSYIKSIIGEDITHSNIENLNDKDRLNLIDAITDYLSLLKAKKKLSVTLFEEEIGLKDYDLNVLKEFENENYLTQKTNNDYIFDLKVLRDSYK